MSKAMTHSELFEMIPGAASSSFPAPEPYRSHQPLVVRRPASDAEQCGYVWCNPKMKVIGELLEKVASWNVPVVLRGESGVGKEVLAREIHRLSPRSAKAFVKINCAALPSDLLESELFGYERGAFTGANKTKPGKFEMADGGTIFLDEIGEMDHPLQAKLLQVLQDGEVHHLGGTDPIPVDSRILVATHRNLEQAIERGTFREDLYYRLHVVDIWVPPLRERRDEILPLARWFLQKHHRRDMHIPSISAELEALLLSYSWPGNVRELENVMRKLLVFADPCGLADELERKTAWQNRFRSAPPPAASKLTSGSLPQFPAARNTAPVSFDMESDTEQEEDPTGISKLLLALSSYGAPVSPDRPFGFSREHGDSPETESPKIDAPLADDTRKGEEGGAAGPSLRAGPGQSRPNDTGGQPSAELPNARQSSLAFTNLGAPISFLNGIQIAGSTVAGVRAALPQAGVPVQAATAEPPLAPMTDSCRQAPLTLDEVDEQRNTVERQAILTALRQSGWNRKRAAKLLRADYKALLYRMKKLSIDEADEG
jgi:transcriptional regulator with GAF, ATPase, and Fis domain